MRPLDLKNQYYLMRHGRSLANESGIIVSAPEIGIHDYGLTDEGRMQARNSVEASGLKPAWIFSSDFKRARETGEIASSITQAPLKLDGRLRERFFGAFNGQSDENYRLVWEMDAKAEDPGRSVELPHNVLIRTLGLISECEQIRGPVLLVAHGDVCQILLSWAAGRNAWEHRSLPHMQTAEIRRFNP